MQDLIVTEPVLKWFWFRQNNSGGYFISNEMVSEDVFIQAYSAKQALSIADGIFEDNSEYCECCGERWHIWCKDSDGTDEPSKYGESIYLEYKTYESDSYATLHWLNGLVDKYYPKTREVK